MQNRKRARPVAAGPSPKCEYRRQINSRNSALPQTVGSVLTAVPAGTRWTIKSVGTDAPHRLGDFQTREQALRFAAFLAERTGALVIA
jgi:hypothetical protein